MTYEFPKIVQAIGLACVPVADMPPHQPALAHKPVAAAIVTLSERADGHREVIACRMSDAGASEMPLPQMIDRALVPGAPKIISEEDRVTLAVDAISRRFFVEPALAALCFGEQAVDPTGIAGVGVDERAVCRRLSIPTVELGDREVELAWTRGVPQAAESMSQRRG